MGEACAVVTDIIIWCFLAIVVTLFGVIVLRLFSNQIIVRGLIAGQAGGRVEPERVQALIVAIAVPVLYAADAIAALRSHEVVTTLPDVADWMLVTGGGSQVLYVIGKLSRQIVSGNT